MALINSGSNTPANQNGLLTNVEITREALRVLSGSMPFIRKIYRQLSENFGNEGRKIGYTINVRKPSNFVVSTDQNIVPQTLVEDYVPVKIDNQYNIALKFTQADLLLSIDAFSANVIEPAVKKLAAFIEQAGMLKCYSEVFNQVGTPGTAITNTDVFWDSDERLSNFMVPVDMRIIIANPRARNQASKLVTTLFTPKLNDDAIVNHIGEAFGYEWFLSQYLPTHTVGAYGAGATLVAGASQTGATLVADGFAASAVVLKKGDIFTMANVFAVNPMTGTPYTFLQQFVVTADVTSSAGGVVSIPVYPSIIATGAQKTVSALPADNAPITIAGASGSSYAVNLAFHRDAFAFVTAPLSVDAGNFQSVETDPETGLSIRYTKQYTITSDETLHRLDVLAGFATLRPELAVRVVTA